jgi:LmbE family N-acetylglucosaminyl deacetylase
MPAFDDRTSNVLHSWLPMSQPLRLTAILAHPDDESLGFGGVIAKYAAEGVEVSLITATRGERGRYLGERDGPTHPGPEKLAVMREAELRAAATALGIRDLSILGYLDGRLDQADAREVVGRIAAHLRRLRPHVVVTFAHDGAYGHPDHIAICQFATAGVVAAASPAPHDDGAPHAVSKLYYLVGTQESMDAYQSVFKKLTSFVDGVEREASGWPDWEITTVVDTAAHWETVWKAVSCHYSQIASYQRLKNLPPEHHAALWGSGRFYRVFSTVNGGRRRESDLFEGLRD